MVYPTVDLLVEKIFSAACRLRVVYLEYLSSLMASFAGTWNLIHATWQRGFQ